MAEIGRLGYFIHLLPDLRSLLPDLFSPASESEAHAGSRVGASPQQIRSAEVSPNASCSSTSADTTLRHAGMDQTGKAPEGGRYSVSPPEEGNRRGRDNVAGIARGSGFGAPIAKSKDRRSNHAPQKSLRTSSVSSERSNLRVDSRVPSASPRVSPKMTTSGGHESFVVDIKKNAEPRLVNEVEHRSVKTLAHQTETHRVADDVFLQSPSLKSFYVELEPKDMPEATERWFRAVNIHFQRNFPNTFRRFEWHFCSLDAFKRRYKIGPGKAITEMTDPPTTTFNDFLNLFTRVYILNAKDGLGLTDLEPVRIVDDDEINPTGEFEEPKLYDSAKCRIVKGLIKILNGERKNFCECYLQCGTNAQTKARQILVCQYANKYMYYILHLLRVGIYLECWQKDIECIRMHNTISSVTTVRGSKKKIAPGEAALESKFNSLVAISKGYMKKIDVMTKIVVKSRELGFFGTYHDSKQFLKSRNNPCHSCFFPNAKAPIHKKPRSKIEYQVLPGKLLNNRYLVKAMIGEGGFGKVFSAEDQSTREMVAIKIIENREPFFLQAEREIAFLKELNHKDQGDNYNIVTLVGTFLHRHHQCIVFELLSFNLYDLLKKTNFQGVSLDLVKEFGKHLLKTLTYLEKLKIVHGDLKPNNILLREEGSSLIKVIDFGLSCKADQPVPKYVATGMYEAPEVLLEQGYGLEIDMWSLGCILVELHTGEPLFCGSNEYEQMMLIVCLKGIPESYLLENNQTALRYFSRSASGEWKFDLNKAKYVMLNNGSISWTEQVFDLDAYPRSLEQVFGLDKVTSGHWLADYKLFIDLLTKMLEYDPAKRIKPRDALDHKFFEDYCESSVQEVQMPEQSTMPYLSRLLECIQINSWQQTKD